MGWGRGEGRLYLFWSRRNLACVVNRAARSDLQTHVPPPHLSHLDSRTLSTLSRTKRDPAFAGRESPADFITGEGPLTVEMKMGASRPFCWRVTPIPASSPSCWPPAVADHSEIHSSGVVITLAPCLGQGAEQVAVRGARSGVGGASVCQRAGMVVRRGYPWEEGGLGRATSAILCAELGSF